MQQVTQNFKTGELSVANVPAPSLRPGGLLIRTEASVISAGTEGSTVRTAQRGLVGKARERPDLVRQVLQTAQREGIGATIQKVRARLDTVKGLGYSASGVVIGVGEGVEGFSVGDRVACAGVGYACHAEVNWVPRNLCARIPAGVGPDAAALATLGAIALQGIHQAELPFGASVGVVGLGLIGQITGRLLSAGGYRVFGVDVDPRAVEEARAGGIDEACGGERVAERAMDFTRQQGLDAVIITASSNSGAVVDLAVEMVRDRGVVCVLGGVRIDIPKSVKSLFYDKEARLVFSRSYGPGRYDPDYEERGFDYPLGYVRWTEGRNLQLFLDMVSRGKLRLDGILTHEFPVERAEDAFQLVTQNASGERFLGIVLRYPEVLSRGAAAEAPTAGSSTEKIRNSERALGGSPVGIGLLGVGNFARGTLLPALAGAGPYRLVGVSTSSGLTAASARDHFGIARVHESPTALLADGEVDAAFVLTRHDSHADLVVEALDAGRHVFVEKPLALNEAQLARVAEAQARNAAVLMVGYNRRFSEGAQALRKAVDGTRGPFQIDLRVNAGAIPGDHWYQDPAVGGGRIIGEGGHFVDLIGYLLGATPVTVRAESLADETGRWGGSDNVAATIRWSDGSVSTLRYVAAGDPSYGKERVEVMGGGMVAVLDDLKRLEVSRGGKVERKRFRGGKGHREELCAFLCAISDGTAEPIPMASLMATSRATFAIERSRRRGGELEWVQPPALEPAVVGT